MSLSTAKPILAKPVSVKAGSIATPVKITPTKVAPVLAPKAPAALPASKPATSTPAPSSKPAAVITKVSEIPSPLAKPIVPQPVSFMPRAVAQPPGAASSPVPSVNVTPPAPKLIEPEPVTSLAAVAPSVADTVVSAFDAAPPQSKLADLVLEAQRDRQPGIVGGGAATAAAIGTPASSTLDSALAGLQDVKKLFAPDSEQTDNAQTTQAAGEKIEGQRRMGIPTGEFAGGVILDEPVAAPGADTSSGPGLGFLGVLAALAWFL